VPYFNALRWGRIDRARPGRREEMLKEILERLPEGKGAVVVLSGGLDSTTALRLAVEKYGAGNVRALTFFYGQRQAELGCAKRTAARLGVRHRVVDIRFLGEMNQGFCANVDRGIEMPTIDEVEGDPMPKTCVSNRNMILLSIAAAEAETSGLDVVLTGLQVNDRYNYHDCTSQWLGKLNALLDENRVHKVRVVAPFIDLTKVQEIQTIVELDGNLDVLGDTLTCYNPDPYTAQPCMKCPSCAERAAAFEKAGFPDPGPKAFLERFKAEGARVREFGYSRVSPGPRPEGRDITDEVLKDIGAVPGEPVVFIHDIKVGEVKEAPKGGIEVRLDAHVLREEVTATVVMKEGLPTSDEPPPPAEPMGPGSFGGEDYSSDPGEPKPFFGKRILTGKEDL